jgi:hypothetical protein
MGEAVLRIRAEGGPEVSRLLADVERLLDASRARSRRARVREQQEESAGYRTNARAAEREEALVTRSKLRELARRGDAQRRFQAMYAEAEREATRLIETEVGKRGNLTERERRQVETLALAIVSTREQAERRATQIAINGERERTRARTNAARQVLNAAGQVVSGGASLAQGAHGMIQGAREQRAALQESVIGAVSQVGVSDLAEVNRITDEVVNAGIRHGLSPQVIAQAVAAAQTQFSTLGAMENLGGANNTEARMGIYRGAIATAVEGRNLGVDPGEFSRLMGMLGSSGMTARDRSTLAAWTVGAQDRGAVETGSVTREALGPIMQRMSAAGSALGPNATAEQRSAAMRDAYRQAFAELQVFRGLGETVRRSGNAMVGFERSLSNTGVLTRMKGNIDAMQGTREQRAAVRTALFDAQGNLRSGLNNPLQFASALMGAGMTDPRAIANLFAGTGAGNPMSLQANWRNMLAGLAARDANGRSGADRVNALMAADVALSPEQRRARAALYESSDAAKLASEEASRLKALTNNTSEINRLSSTIASWAARNPLLASAAPTVAGGVAALLGAKGVALGSMAVGFVANQRAALEGRDLQGNRVGGGERALRAIGMLPGMQLFGTILGARDAYRAATDSRTVERMLDMLPGAIASAVRDNPPSISQHDATHLATVAQARP